MAKAKTIFHCDNHFLAKFIFRLTWIFFLFQGIFISKVSEGGPSDKAGVLVGDRLLEVREKMIIV